MLPLIEPRTHLIGVKQLSTLCGGVAFTNLSFDLCMVRSQPCFLLVEHRNSMLDVFVHGLVRTALDVLANQRFKFRPKSNLHLDILLLQSSDSTTQYTPVGYVSVRS